MTILVLVLIWIEYGKEPGQQIVKVVLSIGISAAKTDPGSPLVIDRLWEHDHTYSYYL